MPEAELPQKEESGPPPKPKGDNAALLKSHAEDIALLHEKQQNLELREKLYHDPTHVELRRADFVSAIGKYMAPTQDTLVRHHHLVLDRSNGLDYHPMGSPFDNVVTQMFRDPAFSKTNHPNYFDYEPLRDNIAIVRNYILSSLSEGVDLSSDENKSKTVRNLEDMGREIGVALERGMGFPRPGVATIDATKASQPGEGAAEIYKFLLEKQSNNKFFHGIKSMFGFDYSSWNLPPLDVSPFTQENVEAFKSHGVGHNGDTLRDFSDAEYTPPQPLPAVEHEVPQDTPAPIEQDSNNPQKLAVIGASLAGTAFSLERVRKLPKPVREESIEIARYILDNLKFGVGESAPRDAWLMRPEEQVIEESNSLVSVAGFYADVYNNAVTLNPNAKNDAVLLETNETLGKLAYLVKETSAQQHEANGNIVDAELLRAEIANYPDSWKNVDETSMGAMLDRVKAGLDRGEDLVKQALADGVQLAPVEVNAANAEDKKGTLHDPAILAATLDAQILQQVKAQVVQQQNKAQAPLSAEPVKITPVPDALKGLSAESLAAVRKMNANMTRQTAAKATSMAGAEATLAQPDPKAALRKGPQFASVSSTSTSNGAFGKSVDYRSTVRPQEAEQIKTR
ncbi:MAG: hypothetical protein FJX23_04675 [Alphaproteobacteria bacterium]|nr:hypothetical protein [Alphaproteobacteria bacterium]